MSSPDPKPAAAPKRRRWRRRLAILAVFLLALVAALPFASREYYRVVGERELAAVLARLDAEDPGWRLDDIQAARAANFPPDAENSANVVVEVIRLLPPNTNPLLENKRFLPPWAERPPSNHLPFDEERAAVQEELDDTRAAVTEAMRLRSMPRGGRVLEFAPFSLETKLTHAENTRLVARLLVCEADLAALRGEPRLAIEAAAAAANAGRAIGDEPVVISQLVRLACARMSAQSAVRAVAWSKPVVGLDGLQQALLAEADEPYLRRGLRGERASISDTFDCERDGRADADLAARGLTRGRGLDGRMFHWWHRRQIAGDQALYLDLMSGVGNLDPLPYAEQTAAAKRLESALHARTASHFDYLRYRWTVLLMVGVKKFVDLNAAGRAEVRSAAALLACERFRLAHGRWPDSPADIPAAVLREWPADPFDGKPLRFRRLPDGVAVYSIGTDGTDDGGAFHKAELQTRGYDLGFRLWDANKRGLPPTEEAPEPREVNP